MTMGKSATETLLMNQNVSGGYVNLWAINGIAGRYAAFGKIKASAATTITQIKNTKFYNHRGTTGFYLVLLRDNSGTPTLTGIQYSKAKHTLTGYDTDDVDWTFDGFSVAQDEEIWVGCYINNQTYDSGYSFNVYYSSSDDTSFFSVEDKQWYEYNSGWTGKTTDTNFAGTDIYGLI